MKDNLNNKLLIIDGNSVLYRGYFASLNNDIVVNSKGVWINAVCAFANILNKILKMCKPRYCVVAFDKAEKTFRNDLYPEYKAERPEMPEELKSQFTLVREMLKAYNISYIGLKKYEADDIIGSLVNKYKWLDKIILSSDKDLYQLINDRTVVYSMKKGLNDMLEVDREKLKEIMNLYPEQIVDFKSLAGDKSDNIKGINGIGEKTAIELLNTYGNVENIYNSLDELKKSIKKKFEDGKDDYELSKMIVSIKNDIKLNTKIEDLIISINKEKLEEFFKKYDIDNVVWNKDIIDDYAIEEDWTNW